MITVVFSTREDSPSHIEHIIKTAGLGKKHVEVLQYINNGEYSLTELYNKALKESSNDIVVFCHDDIIFEKGGWGRKVRDYFRDTDYGILGIAGTTDMDESGRWWTDASKMVGNVKHSHNGRTWENKYSGTFPKEILQTVIVDGLFFAVDRTKIKESFDEEVKGFHFYEIDFCFRNHLSGVKVGVIFDVKVIHKSIGQTNDQWEENRKIFAERFKSNLPLNIKVNPKFDTTFQQISEEPKLKILIHSKGEEEKIKRIHQSIVGSEYNNYEIKVVLTNESENTLEGLDLPNTQVVEGMYDSLHKNVSILKWDGETITPEDELILFLNEDINIESNIINRFVSVYNKNKSSFGGIFPRILNSDDTILASGIGIQIVHRGEKSNVRCDLKGMNSYYGYTPGLQREEFGNIGFCFMSTYQNLEKYGWFRLDFETTLFESDFACKCSADNKTIYVDNESVVKLDYDLFKDEYKMQSVNKDLNTLFKSINENEDTRKLVKEVRVESVG
jgi:GT2 family glycosyltransferase